MRDTLLRILGKPEPRPSPVVLPHQPLLPRCVNGIAPVGVAHLVVAVADAGSAMSAASASLIAAARRQTFCAALEGSQ
jgi:hypothetical protein